MKTRTLDLAYEWGLNIVEVTQGVNGYPEGLYKAIAGFDYFENAEDFAEQVNGAVVLLSRRDGHALYTNKGRTYEGIERAKFIDGDKYEVFEDESDFEQWCCEEVEWQRKNKEKKIALYYQYYGLSLNAGNGHSHSPTKENRKKVSEMRKRTKMSDETKDKIRQAAKKRIGTKYFKNRIEL